MDDQTLQHHRRYTPQSEIDLNLRLTDPVYGTPEINPNMRQQLEKGFFLVDADGKLILDEHGKPQYNPDNMWDKLNMYTRDLRLGNIEGAEIPYCQWYLDFAADTLQEGFYESFIVALTRAVTIIELSQSKKGFLRRRPNTLRTEHVQGDLEPPRRSLLGGGKKNN